MRQTDKIDNLIKNLKTTASDELDQRIDALIEQKTPNQMRSLKIWSKLMKNPITRYAAVLLIIATLSSIFLFSNFTSEAIAFEEVIEAMKNIKWLYQTSNGFQGDISGNAEQWIGFEAKIHAGKWADGKGTFYDVGKQVRYEYDPQNNVIVVTDATGTDIPFSIASPTAMVEGMHTMLVQQGAEVTIESTAYAGKKAQLQQFLLNINDQKQCLKLYINPKSKLLIGAEITATDANGKTIMAGEAKFSYPETGPTNIYDLGVPKNTPIRGHGISDRNNIEDKVKQIDELKIWPEPVELVQKYWDARNNRDYSTTRLCWPNSDQWDEKVISQETPVEYVFGQPAITETSLILIPYASKNYYQEHQKYQCNMVLSKRHSQKERYYIVSGN